MIFYLPTEGTDRVAELSAGERNRHGVDDSHYPIGRFTREPQVEATKLVTVLSFTFLSEGEGVEYLHPRVANSLRPQ